MERLLRETSPEDLRKIFSADELRDSGVGPGRAASLAARFAAKEACLKLFPRETALGAIGVADFSVVRDNYSAPQIVCNPTAIGCAQSSSYRTRFHFADARSPERICGGARNADADRGFAGG